MAPAEKTMLIDLLFEFRQRERPHCGFPESSPLSSYHRGCRCELCVAFRQEYMRLWRSGKFESSKRHGRIVGPKHKGWPSYVCIKCNQTKRAAVAPHSSICTDCIESMGSLGLRIRAAKLDENQARPLLGEIKCGICQMRLTSLTAVFDHDHKISRRTTKDSFRGLLCTPCNTRLGALESLMSLGLLDQSFDYIKRTQR
jgi:hypothetical protein